MGEPRPQIDRQQEGTVPPPAGSHVVRVQRNLLARGERRILTWLCARLPAFVTPDGLTSLGFVGALTIGAGYALSVSDTRWLWLTMAGYVVQWFGDSLDGSLARFRHIERPNFGYFIDHSTDALANLIFMIGLGISPFVRLDVALFAIASYLLLSIHTFLSVRVVGEMNLTYLAGGPTELRLMLMAMTLCMIGFGPVGSFSPLFSAYDLFIGGMALILVALFIVQTAALARRLRRLESR
ncbi:MAG TPA: CDP-alcohol phosphatidyltransferase family protein [Sphingobium sp.]|nr:CDP-alcohol phosphatidyltransferase family protein [Sphingobium sp.]